MKNPLRKRLLRELRSDFTKYLVIFILMVLSISEGSGFLVAAGSMITAYNEAFEKYNIEDGNFRTSNELNKAQRKNIQNDGNLVLYDNFYVDQELTNDSTMRIYSNREDVDRVCVMEGRLAEKEGEIAIDRMYADNNDLKTGDTLETEDGKLTLQIVGLVALSDYSALFENNNDMMFDASDFGVSVVTEETFQELDKDNLIYNYAWKYNVPPANDEEEADMAEETMKVVGRNAALKAFVPQLENKAIQFTGEDFGSDKTMIEFFIYVIIVIIAFVFAVTISNTITTEANVIGTLRASGYTRNELIRHYMTLPLVVTIISALLGNILGYTVMKDFNADLYYGSYSLPTFVTLWNAEAFVKTTAIPIILMLVITYGTLRIKLSLSPLKFLRRDLSRRKNKRALRLSKRIPFFSRFRLRILFQNFSNYVIMFVGIFIANILLLFGIAFPKVLDNYQQLIQDNMIAKYQYILSPPLSAANDENKLGSLLDMLLYEVSVDTDNEDAEKFTAYELKTLPSDDYMQESISFYGIEPDSKYLPLEVDDGQVYISSVFAEKYELAVGDTFTLKESYEDTTYDFQVSGIYEYEAGLCVFMDREDMNEIFDLDQEYFSGYFSNSEITDIDEQYIGTIIDLDALSKVSRQLMLSMGSMMDMVSVFAVFMSLVLIYVLSKLIIEKNVQSISLTKILGYRNSEIALLYIVTTSIMVVISVFATLSISKYTLIQLFEIMMKTEMTGWIPLDVDNASLFQMAAMVLVTYILVAFLEFIKIRKIRMDEALKNVE